MALTGLFICLFLIVHLGANLLLLLPAETARPMYNAYSAALRGNPFIKVIAYVNYLCILLHVFYAIVLTVRNRVQRSEKYSQFKSNENSSWTSQNMGLLGTVLFAFITVHLLNFWYRVKFLNEGQDLYQMVMDLFRDPSYALFYTIAMVPLALHLSSGVKAGFKSLGLYHRKYLKWIAHASVVYAAVVSLGYAIIPVILYVRSFYEA